MSTGTTFTIKLNAETAEAFSKLANFAGSVTNIFQNLLPQIAAGFGIEKIAEHIGEAIKQVDELSKAAQRIGIAVTELSTLDLPAKTAAIDVAQIGSAMRGLSKVVTEANNPASEAARTFRELGISLRDSNGNLRSEKDLLLQLADKFHDLPDGITKTRLATELFTRSGQNMIPFLNKGSEEIRKLQQEARIMGLEVGPEFAANATHFEDNLTKIKAFFEGIWRTIVQFLLPELNKLTDWFVDFAESTSNGQISVALEALIGFFKVFEQVLSGVLYTFDALGSFIGTFAGELSSSGDPFAAWNAAADQFWRKSEALEKRLNEIWELGNKRPAPAETNENDPLDAQKALRAQYEWQSKLLDLRIQENESITKKIELDKTLDPAARQAALNDQYQIEIDLLQKKRDLVSAAAFGGAFPDQTSGSENTLEFKPGTITDEERRAAEIKEKNKQISTQGQKTPETISGNLDLSWHDLQKQWGTVAQQIGHTFTSVIGTAVSSISDGITGLIMETKTWGQALMEIGKSIVTSIVQAFSEMVVKWVFTHVIMAAISRLFRTKETLEEAAHTTAKVAIHTTGETAKTGATLTGSIARGVVHVGETIFHGIQVAFRTASHIAGEIAMTAASIVQSGIRLATILAESIAYVIKSAVEAMAAVADIPYVGPILAIAALGAVLAAGYAAVNGGFQEGGFTGAGGASEVAGVVHKGEFVFSAPAVQRIGAGNLDAMHSGKSGGIGSSSGSRPSRIVVLSDERKARDYGNDPNFEHTFINLLAKHSWRYRR